MFIMVWVVYLSVLPPKWGLNREETIMRGPTRRAFVYGIGTATLVPLATGDVAAREAGGPIRTVVAFDPAAGELPESVAFDTEGNGYVTLGSGAIRRFSPRDLRLGSPGEDFATVPDFEPGVDLLLGVTVAPDGTVYAVSTSATIDLEALSLAPSGGTVWRIGPDGTADRLVDLPTDPDEDGFPNDLLYRDEHEDLLVTDSLGGAIWRVTLDGEASPWLTDPLLEPDPEAPFLPIGVNGIVAGDEGIYVANTTAASVVHVPTGPDGAAGTPHLVAQEEQLFGADGIALDAEGNAYVAVAVIEAVARVGPGGTVEIVAGGEGLAFPSALAFGTAPGQRCTLFVTNFDAVEALTGGDPEPSLAALDVGIPGRPV